MSTTARRKAARGADLRGWKRQGTIAGSIKTGNRKGMAARPQSKGNLETYSGRLGDIVRSRREELGISVADFATALTALDVEVTKHAVYHWEKGIRPIPLNAIPAIAKTLKVAIRDLLPAK